ncbi:MAG TPA: hypothetical protein VG894_09175 [Bauldia sp.]|nr:hypothetical protein [Bauldia sp.]
MTSQLVTSDDQAEASWRTTVTSTYGAAWADFGKAKNKRYYDVNMVFSTLHYVTAEPCRNVSVIINRVPARPKLQSSP